MILFNLNNQSLVRMAAANWEKEDFSDSNEFYAILKARWNYIGVEHPIKFMRNTTGRGAEIRNDLETALLKHHLANVVELLEKKNEKNLYVQWRTPFFLNMFFKLLSKNNDVEMNKYLEKIFLSIMRRGYNNNNPVPGTQMTFDQHFVELIKSQINPNIDYETTYRQFLKMNGYLDELYQHIEEDTVSEYDEKILLALIQIGFVKLRDGKDRLGRDLEKTIFDARVTKNVDRLVIILQLFYIRDRKYIEEKNPIVEESLIELLKRGKDVFDPLSPDNRIDLKDSYFSYLQRLRSSVNIPYQLNNRMEYDFYLFNILYHRDDWFQLYDLLDKNYETLNDSGFKNINFLHKVIAYNPEYDWRTRDLTGNVLVRWILQTKDNFLAFPTSGPKPSEEEHGDREASNGYYKKITTILIEEAMDLGRLRSLYFLINKENTLIVFQILSIYYDYYKSFDVIDYSNTTYKNWMIEKIKFLRKTKNDIETDILNHYFQNLDFIKLRDPEYLQDPEKRKNGELIYVLNNYLDKWDPRLNDFTGKSLIESLRYFQEKDPPLIDDYVTNYLNEWMERNHSWSAEIPLIAQSPAHSHSIVPVTPPSQHYAERDIDPFAYLDGSEFLTPQINRHDITHGYASLSNEPDPHLQISEHDLQLFQSLPFPDLFDINNDESESQTPSASSGDNFHLIRTDPLPIRRHKHPLAGLDSSSEESDESDLEQGPPETFPGARPKRQHRGKKY